MEFCLKIVLLSLLALAGGCAQSVRQSAPGAAASRVSAATAPLPTGQPEGVQVNWLPIVAAPDAEGPANTALETVQAALGRREKPETYQILTSAECLRRAAGHASLANMLRAEQQQILRAGRDRQGCLTREAVLLANLLRLQARYERNRAAAQALELYYRKLEAEHGRESLVRALDEVGQALANLDELRRRDFPVAPHDIELARRQTDLRLKQAELQTALVQLDTQLAAALGLDCGFDLPIWPEERLDAVPSPVDVEASVQQALCCRADVLAAGVLVRGLGEETLPVVRRSLGQSHPLLGTSPPPVPALLPCRQVPLDPCELGQRRGQLNQLLADRVRSAHAEVRQAAAALEAAMRQTAVAQDALVREQARAERMGRLRAADQGNVGYFDLVESRLQVRQAENDLVHQLIGWKIAEVRLKESMGLLVVEAGYALCPE